MATAAEGVLGFISIFSVCWCVEDLAKIQIAVTAATPLPLEDEYLPENHPLRKLRIRDNPAVDALPGTIGKEVTVLSGLFINLQKLIRGVVYFHWKFYHDLFSTLQLGVIFSIYIIYPGSLEFFRFLRNPRRSGSSTVAFSSAKKSESMASSTTKKDSKIQADSEPSTVESGSRRSKVSMVVGLVFLFAASITSTINKIVREVSEMLEERQKRKAEESIPIREFPEPEITQNLTKEVKISQTVPGPVCKNETQDYSLPRNPETRDSVEAPTLKIKRRNTLKNMKCDTNKERPLDILKRDMRSEISMEKRMTETEVLAETPKKEVIAEPVIVSGPWIQENAFVPGYKEKEENNVFEKSGVYEREKTPPKPKTLFEAAIPTSSVFVRDPEKEIFDVRARNSPSPRNSRNFKDTQIDEPGQLALAGNIHMSMYNIHAACEHEEDNREELRFESPNPTTQYRNTDLEDMDSVHIISSQRPLAVREGSCQYEKRTKSPDFKEKYSVKNEIAQLRQTVRDELISIRSDEPDEAISLGESDDEYERIIVMKYEKELESKFGRKRETEVKNNVPRRKHSRGRIVPAVENKVEGFQDSSPEKDWEFLDREDLSSDEEVHESEGKATSFNQRSSQMLEDNSRVESENCQQSDSKERKQHDPRNRRESELRSSSLNRNRSSSLNRNRHSGEFSNYSRGSGQISPATSLQNFQIRRRDSFLDLSLDGPRTAESLDRIQLATLRSTLDETAATLKKAISEKNIAQATTQELTDTLHDTAELLSKTSQVLSHTARSTIEQLG
ncbi:uncharacterized protein LOC111715276 [Eurytemora carolleeae]|uniref:uncharacterized protein LOC111715276 n=1 Tax=Eurytemora carolleeae TaxID=1294199 RepID=UPI000C77621E|nr:uncharacterized protein LOC111715276 [Eurytemora carolleeae]|eukprot:XP_023346354.1 uncharacterized protein LOC111715276 [Eurytemora affinis]